MRPIHAVLASVLLVAALVGLLAFVAAPAGLAGEPHPGHPSMRSGTLPSPWQGAPLGWAWGLGVAVILVFGALIHFGGASGAGGRQLRPLLIVAVAVHLAAWTWMVAESGAWAAGAVEARLLGLPRPTAILLFVFWPASLAYSALFVTGFERWVLTEEQRRRFRELVERHRRESD